MKNIKKLIVATSLFIGSLAFAQAPEKMSYQAVVRNTTNNLVTNQAVGMKISILQGTATGTAVYVETQTPTSNANGLVSLEIGGGSVVSGNMATINWANGPYFIKTETDPTGGTNYTITGTSQLLSTPYALYAKTSGSSTPGPAGTNGVDGKTVLNGTSNPTAAIGANGDFFINTSSNTLFGPKAAGAWPTGVSLVGPAGTNGTNGKTIYNAPNNPDSAAWNATGSVGDFFINTASNTLFGPKTATTWPATGVSLVGPTGASGFNGTNGVDGKTVLNGTSNPTAAIGTNGDFFINTSSNTLFGPKAAGAWPTGVSLVGTAGTNGTNGLAGSNGTNGVDGKTVLNGTSNPTAAIGANGDFFINTSSNTLFGPKAAGAWPTGVSLVGPAGSNATVTGSAPIAVNAGVVSLSDSGVTSAKLADASVTMAKINQATATSGQVIKWNGTAWAPAADNDNTAAITNLEGQINAANAAQDTQINQIINVNNTQNTQISAINTLNTTQSTQITQLQNANTVQDQNLANQLNQINTLNTNQSTQISQLQNSINNPTVTNTISGNSFTTTVNGTTSNPITLPAGSNGTNGLNGYNSLVKSTAETAGANCATGGVKLEFGLDANSNGSLEAGEVTPALTRYVCNGATGASGNNGATGATGAAGQGVPTGGTANQVLAKVDGTNYNTQWVTPSAGGSSDNLGNHTATQNLAMGNNSITGANNITASGNVTVNSLIITKTTIAITNNSLPGANRILSTDFPITTTPSYIDITAYPTASVPWSLHGIPGGVDGKIVYIRNTNPNYNLSLQLNSTAESNGNKIYAHNNPGSSTGEVIYTFIYQQSLFSGNGGWLYLSKAE
jgi:hypothetical protein